MPISKLNILIILMPGFGSVFQLRIRIHVVLNTDPYTDPDPKHFLKCIKGFAYAFYVKIKKWYLPLIHCVFCSYLHRSETKMVPISLNPDWIQLLKF